MLLIDTTMSAAEQLLVDIAAAAPPEVELGRPLVAFPDGVLTTIGQHTALLSLISGGASRYLHLDGGRCAEVTEWAGGVETSRRIG